MADAAESRRLILVADDEGDIVDLVTIVLERAGYEVISAAEGKCALALAHERRPVLCILDGTMPGPAGLRGPARRSARSRRRRPFGS